MTSATEGGRPAPGEVERHFSEDPLTFGVVGMGYVGLPLAVEVGESPGLSALGFDVNPRVVEGINAGESHVGDVDGERVRRLREEGRLEATLDFSRLAECDVVSICVPTPLSKTRDPDISHILAAGRAVAEALRPGQLVILESTTYPGTTRDVLVPLLKERGMEPGRDVMVCFSPERVDPANPVWTTRNTPKVIGGMTPVCVRAGVAAYSRFIDRMVPVSSTEAAEMTKLLENTFRAVNIALVNETAQIADRLDVDIWEVIEAADTKPFGFMRFTPGPGLGGHCIPVDPHYLSWKMRTLDYRARFIELASEVNAEMPHFVVRKVQEALNEGRRSVNGSIVLIVGVAYKPDVSDIRESPAMAIIAELERLGAEVRYHDPMVPEFAEEGRSFRSVSLDREQLKVADAVVLVTDHSALDVDLIVTHSRALVDSRNVVARRATEVPEMHGDRVGSWIIKAEDGTVQAKAGRENG
ncbi:MAG: nucleotide sugar dehydrogenase [Gemmatimonadales bacterium]|nr:MAG: nucleotide sugar dehydrogenase [Gemmatimonadales bacterium]